MRDSLVLKVLYFVISLFLGLGLFGQTPAQIDSINVQAGKSLNSNINEAENLILKASNEAKKIGYANGQKDASLNYAILLYKKGIYDSAIIRLTSIKSYFVEKKDSVRQIKAISHLAVAHALKGDFVNAQSNNFEFLRLAESTERQEDIAKASQNIGNIYFSQNELDEASTYYNKSLSLSINNKLRQSVINYNMGLIALRLEQFDAALNHFEISQELALAINNKRRLGQTLYAIGTTYKRMGISSEAIPYIRNAQRVFEELNDKFGLVNVHIELAGIYSLNSEFEKAIAEINKGESLAIKINSLKKKHDVYKTFKDIYTEAGRFKDALRYADSTAFYSDSLLTVEKFKTIEELNKRYQTEKNEANIQLLKKDNKVLESNNRARLIMLVSAVSLLLMLLNLYFKSKRKNKLLFNQIQEQVLLRRQLQNKRKTQHQELITRSADLVELRNETRNRITSKLKIWENEKGFLDKQITQSSLAKILKTNTKYLSIFLHEKDGKGFPHYINYLRVNHALIKLQADADFTNYTIQGMSEQLGYGSSKTFVKAFKSLTGMSLSSYLKELRENKTK